MEDNLQSNREKISQKLNFKASFEEFKQFLFSLRDDPGHLGYLADICILLPHSMNENEFEELHALFLKEKWHHGHDDIIGMFQIYFYDNPNNIDTILQVMNDLPEFYRYDSDLKHPFIRKCIYAIGAQPEPYNIQALEALLEKETEEELIEYLEEQIEKRRTNGRREARLGKANY